MPDQGVGWLPAVCTLLAIICADLAVLLSCAWVVIRRQDALMGKYQETIAKLESLPSRSSPHA